MKDYLAFSAAICFAVFFSIASLVYEKALSASYSLLVE